MVITAASTLEQVKKGIAEHTAWKARIQEAIDTRRSVVPVSHACLDYLCEFGRWLQENPDLRMFNPKHYDKVKKLHAAFHQELGNVLHFALAGKRLEAKERCVYGGAYAQVQAALVAELTSWQRDLSKFSH